MRVSSWADDADSSYVNDVIHAVKDNYGKFREERKGLTRVSS